MFGGVTTRESLLIRIRDPRDEKAWSLFIDIYGPLIYHYARRQSLQSADAADLTQDVLLTVAREAADFRYDPERGRFRSWLYTVARSKLRTMQARAGRQPKGSGNAGAAELLDLVPAPDCEAEAWEQAYRQRLFDWAVQQVRDEFHARTWQAFWRQAVEGAAPREVAGELGMRVNAVYTAKYRVLIRIREEIERVEETERAQDVDLDL